MAKKRQRKTWIRRTLLLGVVLVLSGKAASQTSMPPLPPEPYLEPLPETPPVQLQSGALAERFIELRRGEGPSQAVTRAGCDILWTARVMADNGIGPDATRSLAVGMRLRMPALAECASVPAPIVADLSRLIFATERSVNGLRAQVARLTRERGQLEQTVTELKLQLETSRAETETARTELQTANLRLATAQKELDEARSRLATAETELAEYRASWLARAGRSLRWNPSAWLPNQSRAGLPAVIVLVAVFVFGSLVWLVIRQGRAPATTYRVAPPTRLRRI